MSSPRILLVRFSAIGDCVMAAWAATSIRHRYPEAFLCWAVEARCAAVIDRTELTSRVWELPRDRWKRARWSPKTWAEQISAYGRLRRLKFDVGIDLQGHSKTAICLRLSGAKRRISAKATDAFAGRLNPVYGDRPKGMHVVEWNQQVLNSVGDFRLPHLPIMPHREDAFGSVREHLQAGRRLATISVSAGQPDKAYPAEHWRTVAEALLADGYQVAYLGGPTDSPIAQEGTIDLVGKMPLTQTLAAVQCSHLHLAGDTGTGHMAAACGVPVVSVFGPTDPAVFRPYTTNGIVLREGRETARVAPERVIRAAHELVGREDATVPD
jgi:ADP-heptose:LPS heptosyltransferase